MASVDWHAPPQKKTTRLRTSDRQGQGTSQFCPIQRAGKFTLTNYKYNVFAEYFQFQVHIAAANAHV